MENLRFTLFNGLTFLVMALTLGLALARARGTRASTWPLLYYVVIAAFAFAFRYSLNPYWVGAGALAGLAIRFGAGGKTPRLAEYAVLAYVFGRSVGLILMW